MADRIITREEHRRAKLREAAELARQDADERGILQQMEFIVVGGKLVVRKNTNRTVLPW